MLLIVLLLLVAEGASKRTRQICSVDDERYYTLVALCKGEFAVAVYERTTKQKAAYVRFWRQKSKFSVRVDNGEEKLFFDKKEVMRKINLQNLVTEEFLHCKGAGSRKLKHRLMTRY